MTLVNSLDAIGSVTQTVTSGSLFLAIPLALAAGLISFLSPCVLPLVPGYLSYITGLTGAEIASEDGHLDARGRSRIVIGCTLFVAGFSVVFIALGAAFGAVSGWLLEYQTTIQRVLGLVVIVMGLMLVTGNSRVGRVGASVSLDPQGSVAERPNALALKASVPKQHRGFKSLRCYQKSRAAAWRSNIFGMVRCR